MPQLTVEYKIKVEKQMAKPTTIFTEKDFCLYLEVENQNLYTAFCNIDKTEHDEAMSTILTRSFP